MNPGQISAGRYQKGVVFHPLIASIVLVSGLASTFFIWSTLSQQVSAQKQQEFNFITVRLSQEIEGSLKRYTDVLQGFKGFFKASNHIDRAEFKTFFDTIRETGNYPGLQAISFAQSVARQDKASFEQEMRDELKAYAPDLPRFTINPSSLADYSFVLKFSEPLYDNARSLGLDLGVEKQRRLSILHARDSGEPSATGRIQLLQDDENQAAIAWRIPIYRNNAQIDTLEGRQQGFYGAVNAVLIIQRLMEGLLPENLANKIRFEIYDRNSIDVTGEKKKLLYSSTNRLQSPDITPAKKTLSRTITLDVGGRKWDIYFASLPLFGTGLEASVPLWIMTSGTLISVVLFLLILGLTTSNKKAMSMAKVMAQDLLENQEHTRLMAETIPVSIILLDKDTRSIISMNKCAYDYFATTEHEATGKRINLLFYKSEQLDRIIEEAETKGESNGTEVNLEFRPEVFKWFQVTARITVLEGRPVTLLALSDVTERKQAEQRVSYMAHFDTLTGLSNRNLMQDRLTQAIATAHRYNLRVGIIYLDMDRFKDVNDTLGHNAGDELLKAFAIRLKACVRDADTIARLGGDEFLIIVPELKSSHSLAKMAEKILSVTSEPCTIQQNEIHPSSSIGIAVYPNDGDNAETLLANADTAMYCAKNKGSNLYQFFAEEMNTAVKRRVDLERNLRSALTNEALCLHYQPQFDCVSGLPIGVEALIRWNGEGAVQPKDFIPVAEGSGLINQIGSWVLKEACQQGRKWHDQGLSTLKVAVNISTKQFQQDGFIDMVKQVLAETEFSPACLEFEITETALIEHNEKAVNCLNELHDLNITIAVDDFGTGYSSLSYLKSLPIDILKIDREFVRDIQSDPDDQAIITAIVAMAKTLGLKTVAEGIENAEQMDFLKKLSCDELQGYYFAKPLPVDEVSEFLHKRLNTNIATFPQQRHTGVID